MTIITWDPINKGPNVTLSNGNLTAVIRNYNDTVRATEGKTKGKWYWEIHFSELGQAMVGIINEQVSLSSPNYSSQGARYYYSARGTKFPGDQAYGQPFYKNDVIGIALDLDNGLLEFFKNGISQGISHYDILNMGKVYPAITSGSSTSGNTSTANFGATPFIYSLPEGYLPYDFENSRHWFNQNKILLLSNGQVKTYQENGQWTNINKGLADISEHDYKNYGINLEDLPRIDVTQIFTKKSFISQNPSLLGSGQVFKQTIDTNKYKIKKITIK